MTKAEGDEAATHRNQLGQTEGLAGAGCRLGPLGRCQPLLSGAKRRDSHDAECHVQPVEKICLVLARSAGRREAKEVGSREG